MARLRLPYQSAAVLDAATPLQREILFDATNNRPRVGDGSTAGGKSLAFKSETDALDTDLTTLEGEVDALQALTANLSNPISAAMAPVVEAATKTAAVALLPTLLTVPLLSNLKALNGADLENGCTVVTAARTSATLLDTGGEYIYDAASSATADDGVIVAPADSTGRFISKAWLFRNELHLYLYGVHASASAAANEAAINAAFDFMAATTEAGSCIFPQGAITASWATARDFTKLRGWRLRGYAASQDSKIGTQLNLTGGGASYFIKFISVRHTWVEDIVVRLNGAGFARVFEWTGGDYYQVDGVTVADASLDSCYLCGMRNVLLTSNKASGFDPSGEMLWVHSTQIMMLDQVWAVNCNTGFKFGDTAANDVRKIAKGTAGTIVLLNCYLAGDIEYVRWAESIMIGGQWLLQSGTGAATRAGKLIEGTGADILQNVAFEGVEISSGYGDNSDCWLDTTCAKGVTVQGCNFGKFDNVIEASGSATDIAVRNCGHQLNGGDIVRVATTAAAASVFDVFGISPHPNGSPTVAHWLNDLRHAAPTSPGRRVIGRNFAINSRADIAQRGTSFVPAAAMNMLDCWRGRRSANASGSTYSRQTGFNGAPFCHRVQRDSGNTATDTLYYWQQIESIDCTQFQGKTVRISADVRKGADFSDANSDVSLNIYTGTGTDEVVNPASGFATGNTNTSAGARVVTTTGARYQWNAVAIGASVTELAYVFNFAPVGTAGAADYFEITNIKIEIVDALVNSSTPYEAIDIGTEYLRCARRYEKSFALGTTPAQNVGVNTGEHGFSATAATTGTQRTSRIRYRVPKRDALPAVVAYNPAAANSAVRDFTAAADCGTPTAANQTADGFELTVAGNASTAIGNRLGFHWTCDAEID